MTPRPRHPAYTDILAAEFIATNNGQPACADTCLCHGGYTCQRLPHPHELDSVTPHAAVDTDGNLTQWTCTDPQQRALTPEDHANAARTAKLQHTTNLRNILNYNPDDDED